MPVLPSETLAVPFERQETAYTCGAASLRAVARYWKAEPGSQVDVARACGTTPANGAEPERMVEFARSLGLRVTSATGVSLETLQTSLARGIPVILGLQAWVEPGEAPDEGCKDGHFVVLVALDRDNAYFMDPARAFALSFMFLPVADLLARWRLTDRTGACVERLAMFFEGTEHLTATPPEHADPLQRTEGLMERGATGEGEDVEAELSEAVNFDGAPYRNMRLSDAARYLSGAVRTRPINRSLIGKLIGRLIGGLESAALGVDGRAEADRFSATLRKALATLVGLVPVEEAVQARANLRGVLEAAGALLREADEAPPADAPATGEIQDSGRGGRQWEASFIAALDLLGLRYASQSGASSAVWDIHPEGEGWHVFIRDRNVNIKVYATPWLFSSKEVWRAVDAFAPLVRAHPDARHEHLAKIERAVRSEIVRKGIPQTGFLKPVSPDVQHAIIDAVSRRDIEALRSLFVHRNFATKRLGPRFDVTVIMRGETDEIGGVRISGGISGQSFDIVGRPAETKKGGATYFFKDASRLPGKPPHVARTPDSVDEPVQQG